MALKTSASREGGIGLPLLFPLTPITAPSSHALLPRGEKGATHRGHMLPTVQFTAFFAPYSRHAADMVRFSCVRLRFANRTYGFNTDGLYPNRQAAIGCNKRSAVHRDHMADFPPHPQPFSREGRREQTTATICCQRCNSLRSLHPTHAAFSKVTNPLGGFVTSDERHSSTATLVLSPNHTKIFIHLKNSHLKPIYL